MSATPTFKADALLRHLAAEPAWCAVFRRESALVNRLIRAKNAGLIPGVPQSAGLWSSGRRYWFRSPAGNVLGTVGSPMRLASIAALLAMVEVVAEESGVVGWLEAKTA